MAEVGGGWVLNGRKRWIGLGSVADLVVVWARNTEDGQVNGFVVEKGSPGYQARVEYGGHRQPHDVSQSVRPTDQPAQLDWAALVRQEQKGPSPSTRRSCGASA